MTNEGFAAWAARVRNVLPRFDATAHGHCPVCEGGPVALALLGEALWAACLPCEACWPSRRQTREFVGLAPVVAEQTADEYAQVFHLLASLDLLTPVIDRLPTDNTGDIMPKPTTAPTPSARATFERFEFDPHEYTDSRPLEKIARHQRIAIAGLTVHALGEVGLMRDARGDLMWDRCAHDVWDRIHAKPADARMTVEAALKQQPGGGVSTLRALIVLLVGLRRRRDELARQLQAIDAIADLVPDPAAVPRLPVPRQRGTFLFDGPTPAGRQR